MLLKEDITNPLPDGEASEDEGDDDGFTPEAVPESPYRKTPGQVEFP